MSMRLTICGNSCDACKAFMENYEKLDEREALSAAWKKYVDFDIPAQDIHCEGGPCCAVGLGVMHRDCQIKKCIGLHGFEHCGQCPDYPCSQFDDGRNTGEQDMRDKLGENFNIEEYDRYVKTFNNKFWLNEYRELVHKSRNMTMCGYRCDLCKAYVANIDKKDEREELSRMWKKYYGLDVPTGDIYCDGCRNMKPDAKRVDTGCTVRVCVMEKGIKHCGDCEEYPCQKFNGRIGLSFERAKKELGSDFDADEYKEYIEAYDNVTRINEYRNSK